MKAQIAKNKECYINTHKKIRRLVSKVIYLSEKKICSQINNILEEVLWSEWGLYGHNTKLQLLLYIKKLKFKISNDCKHNRLTVYKTFVFDAELKNIREKMSKAFIEELER